MKAPKTLVKIILGILIFVAAVLLIRAVLNYAEGRRLTKTLAGLQAKGIPLSLKELYSPCPDADNGARLWRAAEELFVMDGPDIRLFSEVRQEFRSGNRIAPEKREGIARIIDANRKALDLLLEASEKSCFLYGDVDVKAWERRIPNAIKMIRAVSLMGFESVFAAEEGDMKNALDRLRAGFRFTELAGQDKSLISHLIAVADMKQLLLCLNRALSNREADAGLLLPVMEALGDSRVQAWRDMFGWSLEGERLLYAEVGLEFMGQELPRWVLGDAGFFEEFGFWLVRPFLKRDLNRNLSRFDELEDLVRLPFYQAREGLASYKKDLERLPWYAFVSKLTLPGLDAACMKQASLEALILTARSGLACRVFKARTGRYPDSLAELAPDLIPKVPIDPFTGDPLIFRREGEGFLVYSLGSNQKDDGGRSTWEVTQLIMEKDDDWGWREIR